MTVVIRIFIPAFLLLCCMACGHGETRRETVLRPDTCDQQAIREMQGVWVDADTHSPFFWVKGDSVFFADSTSVPVILKMHGDTLWVGNDSYQIESRSRYRLSFFTSLGNVISLQKSSQEVDTLAFSPQTVKPVVYTEVTKRDTVVSHGNHRYHAYITVNPTSIKVYRTTYTADGMAVENFSFDNVIHLSVYEGRQCLFRSNFNKSMFEQMVPEEFLCKAILSDIVYLFCDAKGIHFQASICVPDSVSCYAVELVVDENGELTMELMG